VRQQQHHLRPEPAPAARGHGLPVGHSTAPWWRANQTTNRAIEGNIATSDCQLNTCPDNDLIFLVEDYGASAPPPGVGGTAYFVALRTNGDPAGTCGIRWFDVAKAAAQSATCNGTNAVLRQMLQFPTLKIASSGKTANDVVVTTNYGRPGGGGGADDVGDNAFGFAQAALPDNSIIASIDILAHTGPSDPGRDRFATCGGAACTNQGLAGNCCWTQIRSIPYANGPIAGDQFTIDCGNRTEDIWVAAGITFQGGSAALNVKSALVGRAVQVQCDPATANPQPKVRPGAGERRTERPTRSGGGR
jgi:hypothetical protein